MTLIRQAILIAGPTASGKSALAIELAQECDGLIVNADSMQIYDVLRVLTARPDDRDLALVPHRLYGFVAPNLRFSTGEYVRKVQTLLADVHEERKLIFVGGTGLYFDALINGFTSVPDVPAEIVADWDQKIVGMDGEARRRLLAEKDPMMSAKLGVVDPQRLVRALSVLDWTGKSLAQWQSEPAPGALSGFALERIVLSPPRDLLRQRIATRFGRMLYSGAVEEVQSLLRMEVGPDQPLMKAIGVREIGAMLNGEITEAEAIEKSVIATQQYAKRQRTWFRNRMAEWDWRER